MYYVVTNDQLAHHGILGQKWGVRRYQNEDGSLTNAGRRRYNKDNFKEFKRESMHGRDETSATKKFFESNPELLDKMHKLSDKQMRHEIEYDDLDRKLEIAEIKYGEKSKQYQSILKKRDKIGRRNDSEWEERASAWDEMLSKGRKYINDTFGEYKNKTLRGLNIRYGKATVEKLFFADLERNWYKHVPNGQLQYDDWTR